ncbi:MAG: DUF4097 domain-containing protein [Rhodothermaceae bacterium]|nr:DUF4097 domain-containing protein [Rhodothermaceae bacterium]
MRSFPKHILAATLFLAFAIVVPASAQVEITPIKQQFAASAVSELIVNVPNANLTIQTSDRFDVEIQVVVTGKKQQRVDDYYLRQRFDVVMEEGTLRLLSAPDWKNLDTRGWRNDPPVIDVTIAMPATVHPRLRTSSGEVRINELKAGAEVRSTDGSITVNSISGGPIKLQSSDGDITAKELRGTSVTAKTVNGNVAVGFLDSDHAEVRTSDGSITSEKLQGESVIARTTNGDIEIGEITSKTSLLLQTSDGSITTKQIDASSLTVKAFNGDLNLGVVSSDHAEIRTSDGNITSEKTQGESVIARTTNGDIEIGELTSKTSLLLQTSDGNITTKQVDASSLIVKAVNGDLNLGAASSNKAEIRTSSKGNIKVDNIISRDELTLRSSVGSIAANQIDASSLIVKAVNGDLNLGVATSDNADIRTSNNGNIKVDKITSS